MIECKKEVSLQKSLLEQDTKISYLPQANEILPQTLSKVEEPHYVIEGVYENIEQLDGQYPKGEKLQLKRLIKTKNGSVLAKEDTKYKNLSSLILEKEIVYQKYNKDAQIAFNLIKYEQNKQEKERSKSTIVNSAQYSSLFSPSGRDSRNQTKEDDFLFSQNGMDVSKMKTILRNQSGDRISTNYSVSCIEQLPIIKNKQLTQNYECYQEPTLEQLNQKCVNQTSIVNQKDSISKQQIVDINSEEISFSSNFECGNLSYVFKGSSNKDFILLLQNDINTAGFTQWFFFKVSNKNNLGEYTFNIVNCSKKISLFQKGMRILAHSQVEKDKKKKGWHRAGTSISYFANKYINTSKKGEDGEEKAVYNTLQFTYSFEHINDQVFFAYNYPYSYSDMQKYLENLEKDNYSKQILKRRVLCRTLANNKVELLTITNPKSYSDKNKDSQNKKVIVICARVHPGETVSSFMAKGFIDFLLSSKPEAIILRDNFIFKVVPMLNPDGVVHGNYRCSLSGKDLNRQWKKPNKMLHREIYELKKIILNSEELSLFCDLHGHSMKKNIFVYGCHDSTQPSACRELPFILSKIYQPFQYQDCNFRIAPQKKGTARLALFHHLKIPNIFTLESSFCGPSYDNVHFQPLDLERMGASLCKAFVIYFHPIIMKRSIPKEITLQNEIKQNNEPKKNVQLEDQTQIILEDVERQRSHILQELQQNENLLQLGMDDSDGSESTPSENEYFEAVCSEVKKNPSLFIYDNISKKRRIKQIDSRSLPPVKSPKKNQAIITQQYKLLKLTEKRSLSPIKSNIIKVQDITLESCPVLYANNHHLDLFTLSPSFKSFNQEQDSKYSIESFLLSPSQFPVLNKRELLNHDKLISQKNKKVEQPEKQESKCLDSFNQQPNSILETKSMNARSNSQQMQHLINVNKIQLQQQYNILDAGIKLKYEELEQIKNCSSFSIKNKPNIVSPIFPKSAHKQPHKESCSLSPFRSSKDIDKEKIENQLIQSLSTILNDKEDLYCKKYQKKSFKVCTPTVKRNDNIDFDFKEKIKKYSRTGNHVKNLKQEYQKQRLQQVLKNDINIQQVTYAIPEKKQILISKQVKSDISQVISKNPSYQAHKISINKKFIFQDKINESQIQ